MNDNVFYKNLFIPGILPGNYYLWKNKKEKQREKKKRIMAVFPSNRVLD